MTFTRKAVALAAVATLALSACQGTTQGPEQQTQDQLAAAPAQYNEQPRDNIADGGTFTTAVGEFTDQLNKWHATANGGTNDLWYWWNPVIGMRTPEGDWSPNPDYLTDASAEDVDGNTVVTYTFNDEATFNDGTPIDWRSIETVWLASNGKNQEFESYSTAGYDKVTSVEMGENEKQAVVTYDGPWVWWQSQFEFILHPEMADPEVFNTAYIQEPKDEWGAGPFHVKDYDPQAGTMVFERNPNWWGEPAKLDERIFRQLDSSAGINAFRNGEVDTTSVSSQENWSQVQGMEGIDIRKASSTGVSFVTLNTKAPGLETPEVRKAVLQGFDRNVLLQIRTQGMNYTEPLPGSLIYFPFQTEYYQDNLAEVGITYDPAAANAALDQAGWVKGEDGLRTKDGEKLSLVWPIFGESAQSTNIGRAVQAMMKEIGVDLQVDVRQGTEFSDTLTKKDYGALSSGWGASQPQYNAAGAICDLYDEPICAEQYAEISQLPDEQEQVDRLNELEQTIFSDYARLPLYNGPNMVATKAGLANYGADMYRTDIPEDIGFVKEGVANSDEG